MISRGGIKVEIDYHKIFTRYDLQTGEKEQPPQELSRDPSLREIIDCVVMGDNENITELVQRNLKTKDPLEIIYRALIPAMEHVSRLWEENIFYLPQTLNSSDAMLIGIEICEKKMGKAIEKKGLVITHTAEGDIHDLGQKIVNAQLRAQGYEVLDLGRDVPVETVIEAVKKHRPLMLTGTAGLTINMDAFQQISNLLREEGFDIPFACGGGGGVSRNYINSLEFGIFGKDAREAPKMAADARAGLTWLQIREKYNE